MSNTKHTPGPWHVLRTQSGSAHHPVRDHKIDVSTGGPMLGRVVQSGARSWDEAKANAMLIAAAPELLEACKAAFQRSCDRLNTKGGAGWTAEDQRVHAALRAAIDKAQGATS